MRPKDLISRIHATDLSAFRAIARWETPLLDATLPRLSHAANHSRLWIAFAAVLAGTGGRRGKRAALRSSMALAIASAAANTAVKIAVRRKRPEDLVPLPRRLRRIPRSSSFPSGHSASAAAFATAVGLEHGPAGALAGALAGAVGFSRIYTGVHYPTDVLSGFALGAGAALVTLRVWPRATEEPIRPTLKLVDVDVNGKGIAIAVNDSAGPSDDGVGATIVEQIPDADVVAVQDGDDLPGTLRELAARASVLGIAGGDGSINAAAATAVEHDVPLLVFPGGTLNHLASNLGLDSIEDTTAALQQRCAAEIDLGVIDGRPFLNTASFGPYPELVDEREKLEDKIGKWPALMVALFKLLRRIEPVEIELDGQRRRIWMIFIGNCRYEPSGFLPARRTRLDDGLLDVRIVYADRRFAGARLLLGLLTGTLARTKVYEERAVRSLEIASRQGPLRLSRDGETFDGSTAFSVTKIDKPLRVFVPRQDDQSRVSARPTTNSTPSSAATPTPVIQGPASS